MATLREALEGAVDGTPVADEPVSTAPPPGEVIAEATEVVEPNPNSGSASPNSDTTHPESGSDGKVRDALGRFVPKTGAEALLGPQGSAGAAPAAPPAPVAPPPDADPPPQSWRPEVKAEWSKLPPAIKQEVQRRELEISRALGETAAARNISQLFSETITPYMAFMRAEGVHNPLDGIKAMFDMHVGLRTGSQHQKAAKLAELMNYYGVDVPELDRALVGQSQENPQIAMQRQIDQMVAQRMAPFQQIVQQAQFAQQQSANAAAQQVSTELQQFAATHPHYETVRTMMADAMQIAVQNGQELSLDDAYRWATGLHPSTKGATIAAQSQQTAQQMNEAAQRAKRAATGSSRIPAASSAVPAGGSNRAPSLRDAINQAMQDVPVQ